VSSPGEYLLDGHANLAIGFSRTYPPAAKRFLRGPFGPTLPSQEEVDRAIEDIKTAARLSLARKPLVFAIDFDGTLAEKSSEKGPPSTKQNAIPHAKRVLTRLHEAGHTLLIDSVRGDNWAMHSWLVSTGMRHMFSGINCNPADVADTGIVAGHLFADVYINDRNFQFDRREHGRPIDWLEIELFCELRSWL
jgi:hypothetical protein